jgi:hypothetical protein
VRKQQPDVTAVFLASVSFLIHHVYYCNPHDGREGVGVCNLLSVGSGQQQLLMQVKDSSTAASS